MANDYNCRLQQISLLLYNTAYTSWNVYDAYFRDLTDV